MELQGEPQEDARLMAIAPGARVAPVFEIGGSVVVGFDRERVAGLLGVELAEAGADDGTWSVSRQISAEVVEAAAELTKDLTLARRVHASMIPPDAEHEHLSAAVRVRPRIGVGGDYASLQRVGEDRYYCSVADVTGHGIASALMVSRVNSWVLSRLAHSPQPHELVRELDRFLYEQFEGLGLFLTFWVGLIDVAEGTLRYCGAAHPPALLLRAGAAPARLASESPLLGVVAGGAAAARTVEVALQPEDLLVLYTDGIIEARDAAGRQFEEEGMLAALEGATGRRVDAVAEGVLQAASRHEPGPASDDRLVMVLRSR